MERLGGATERCDFSLCCQNDVCIFYQLSDRWVRVANLFIVRLLAGNPALIDWNYVVAFCSRLSQNVFTYIQGYCYFTVCVLEQRKAIYFYCFVPCIKFNIFIIKCSDISSIGLRDFQVKFFLSLMKYDVVILFYLRRKLNLFKGCHIYKRL